MSLFSNFKQSNNSKIAIKVLCSIALLFIFLVGIKGLGTGFKGLGKDMLQTFFVATDNPFIGLIIGILATTLVQSSSVTTSMIVALVAVPENPLPITNAIPMIMGANIGTTVTNSIVSLAHAGDEQEFKRAFSTATCHDFFNLLTVIILLPLELLTGFLNKLSGWLASFVDSTGVVLPNPIKATTKTALKPITWMLEQISSDKAVLSIMLIVVSFVIIFTTLIWIVKNFKELATTKLKNYIHASLNGKAWKGFLIGIIATVMVQSSSITTSTLVPIAAAGIISLPQAFPITLGANLGTTITAILASMAVPSETMHLAVQIATVHLLFNLCGILTIYPAKKIRNIPLNLARKLAEIAVRSKTLALIYILLMFYGIPGMLVFVLR